MNNKKIISYFPNCTKEQLNHFNQFAILVKESNKHVNLVSRKDIDNIYLNHILHSLAIAKVVDFSSNSCILDVGTGGGFPGIPLAILFPKVKFVLVDSISKKILHLNNIIEELQLKNVATVNTRVEKLHQVKFAIIDNEINCVKLFSNSIFLKDKFIPNKFDFVLGRAVTSLSKFYFWVKDVISKQNYNNIANGILYLRGNDFFDEIKNLKIDHDVYNIQKFFPYDFFKNKCLVHLKL